MKEYQEILFPYAYNILGTADEAQDVIQDVMLKYLQKEQPPNNEKNYLIRSVINQSLNQKRNRSKVTSEHALPQPILTAHLDLSAEIKDLVSYSLLVLLEQLNPKERAVFILKEAFAYTHAEIGEVLSISVENARKLFSRANAKVQNRKPVVHKNASSLTQKLEQITGAIQSRDLELLHELFHQDIVFRADGGKHIQVVAKYLKSVEPVASLMVEVYHRFHRTYLMEFAELNHQPALLFYAGDELKVCQIFGVHPETHQVQSIYAILDPDKLKLIAGNMRRFKD